jgi:hypothetical protein
MTSARIRLAICPTALIMLALFVSASPALAAPWGKLALFKKIDADPKKSYALKDTNGPWMVLATTFRGPDSDRRAKELTYELRKEFKVEAYTFTKQFDFSEPVQGIGINRFGGPKKGRYANNNKVREVAVLVGNFATVDEPGVEKTLAKIKQANPKSFKTPGRPATATDSAWEKMRSHIQRRNANARKGPMAMAFVASNPMLPREYFTPKGLDPMVAKMNKGVKHSLLKCPGVYSVKVATFSGNSALGDAAIKKYERDQRNNALVDAAEKAHKMCESLRKKGYEAYEFHDRYASFVTVGSFNSAGAPRRDGKIEIDPKIHALIKTFRAEQAQLPQGARGRAMGTRLRFTAGIPHDIQPWIVQVPKTSVASAYVRQSR